MRNESINLYAHRMQSTDGCAYGSIDKEACRTPVINILKSYYVINKANALPGA